MRSSRWRGLRVQILLWTILPFMILLIALSLTGIRSHQRSMRTLVAERDAGLVQVLAGEVSAILDRYAVALVALSRSEMLRHGDPSMVRQAVGEAAGLPPGTTLVVVDVAGRVVAGPDPPPAWAAEALAEPSVGPHEVTVRVTSDGRTIIWAVSLGEQRGQLLAGVAIDALDLSRLLDPDRVGVAGNIVLVGPHGQPLFVGGTSSPGEAIEDWPGVQEALAGESGVRLVRTPEGEHVIAYAPVPGVSGALVLREPWETLAAPLLRFDRVMPFVLLTATVISLLTLFFGLRYVVWPLQKLGMQADRIGRGDFEAAAKPVGGVKEIEDLRRTLDRMARQVQRYQSAVQDYLGAMTRAQEEERARLSRELHDETVQTLIALSQRVQMVQRMLEREPGRAAERLAELRAMIGDAVEEVRRFSRALRPSYLEELGLVPALETLANEAGAAFRTTGAARRLTAEQELALYRVAQEALNNALRHARARRIWIELAFADAGTRLRVRDDGVGFRVPEHLTDLARSGHFGLMGMHERMQLVGGRLIVTSAPGRGTTIEAWVPGDRGDASGSPQAEDSAT
ncbi:MAG TPA: HAMP domain-containing protein [Caldilineae bacterium]|nr:HAMP domain-containing protein [Caldilineae bacterium]